VRSRPFGPSSRLCYSVRSWLWSQRHFLPAPPWPPHLIGMKEGGGGKRSWSGGTGRAGSMDEVSNCVRAEGGTETGKSEEAEFRVLVMCRVCMIRSSAQTQIKIPKSCPSQGTGTRSGSEKIQQYNISGAKYNSFCLLNVQIIRRIIESLQSRMRPFGPSSLHQQQSHPGPIPVIPRIYPC